MKEFNDDDFSNDDGSILDDELDFDKDLSEMMQIMDEDDLTSNDDEEESFDDI